MVDRELRCACRFSCPRSHTSLGTLTALGLNRVTALVAVLVAMTGIALPVTGDALPRIEATTLDNQKIVLPDAARFRAIVLVLGFSRKSAEQTQPWSQRLAADYSSHAEVGYFEVPVLEGVPGLIKPIILRGMRKQTPAARQSHSIPIDRHADELKKICGYKEPDDAYILVASADGRVLWQTRGPISDAAYAEMMRMVSRTLSSQPSGD
jgi:hypothetical protein